MKILIIDDSMFSQKSMAMMLKNAAGSAAIDFAFANDGMEGLKQYRETKPDCVIVDLLMPKLDGKQFVRALDEKERSKVIVVSADVQKSVKKELEDSHILAFINKPLSAEKAKQILDLIRN